MFIPDVILSVAKDLLAKEILRCAQDDSHSFINLEIVPLMAIRETGGLHKPAAPAGRGEWHATEGLEFGFGNRGGRDQGGLGPEVSGNRIKHLPQLCKPAAAHVADARIARGILPLVDPLTCQERHIEGNEDPCIASIQKMKSTQEICGGRAHRAGNHLIRKCSVQLVLLKNEPVPIRVVQPDMEPFLSQFEVQRTPNIQKDAAVGDMAPVDLVHFVRGDDRDVASPASPDDPHDATIPPLILQRKERSVMRAACP